MKKSFIWMCAAALTCGMAFTSCAKMDYPTGPEYYWTKDTKVLDFEDGDVSMFLIPDKNRIAITAVDDAAYGKVAKFAVTNRNQLPMGYYVFGDLTAKANRVTIEFDFNMQQISGDSRITIGDANVHTPANGGFSVSSRNNTGYGVNGAIFQLGCTRGNAGSGTENYFQINGVAKAANSDAISIKPAEVFGLWLHAKVIVNVDDRLVSYVITKDGAELFSDDELPFFNEQAQKCSQFDVTFSQTGTTYIDNLSIESAIDPSIKYANYTIKYVDPDGNEIMEPRTDNGRVGKNPTLLASDMDPAYIDADGKIVPLTMQNRAEWAVSKWLYDSDDAAETVIAEEGTIVTVKFKECEKWNYRLNLVYADDQARIARIDGSIYSGDNAFAGYKIGYQKDGKWYLTPRIDGYKGRSYTFTEAETVELPNGTKRADKQIEYTLQPDIAFIAEFEDKEALTLVGDCKTWIGWGDVQFWAWGHANIANHFVRYSNGLAARLTEGSYFTTPALAAGTYKIYIYGRAGGSAAETVGLYVMDNAGEMTPVDLSKTTIEADAEGNYVMPTIPNTMGYIQIGGIVIPEGGKLVIKNDGNANDLDLDFIALSLNADADLDALTN